MRYFVAGNVWLFIALSILLFSRIERSGPTRLSMFGVGRWFSPAGMNFIAVPCVLLGVAFLIIGSKRSKE